MDIGHQRIAGMPVLLVLAVLGAAGAAGYLLFFRSKSASGDSTPTGYSSQGLAVMQNPDESATMAEQNRELSILNQQLGGGFSSLTDQLTGLGTYVSSGFSSVSDAQKAEQAQISGLGGQFASIQHSIDGSNQASRAYYDSLLAYMTNYANALSSQVGNVSSQVGGVSGQLAAQQKQDLSGLYQVISGEWQIRSDTAGANTPLGQTYGGYAKSYAQMASAV